VFFTLATVFTVVFGGMDLLVDTPKYFRLEPFAQNFCIGVIFLATLETRHNMIERLVEAIPEAYRPDMNREGEGYMKNLTRVWAAYFLIKAFAFLYVALRVNLATLYALRISLGSLSALILLLGEIIYRHRFRHVRS
jgi:uncharacterized membrane protein